MWFSPAFPQKVLTALAGVLVLVSLARADEGKPVYVLNPDGTVGKRLDKVEAETANLKGKVSDLEKKVADLESRIAVPAPANVAEVPKSAEAAPAPKKVVPLDPLWFTVKVERVLSPSSMAVGTGTPIHSEAGLTVILTNAHVARDGNAPLFVTTVTGKRLPAKLVDGSRVWDTGPGSIDLDGPDLALIAVEADLETVTLAEAAPAPGERVWQWGYGTTGNDGRPVMKSGIVQKCSDTSVFSNLPCIQGDSGSGVFDQNGHLVAVTDGKDEANPFSHYAVPVTAVRKFTLRDRVRARFPRLAALGAQLRVPPKQIAPKGGAGAEPCPCPYCGCDTYGSCECGKNCKCKNCPTHPKAAPKNVDPKACPDGKCSAPGSQAPPAGLPGYYMLPNCPNGNCVPGSYRVVPYQQFRR